MVTSTPLSSLSEFREYLESRKHILLPPGDAMLAGDSFIFLIEDLSPNLIELVGSYLSIAPEVFLQYSSGGEANFHRYHRGRRTRLGLRGLLGRG